VLFKSFKGLRLLFLELLVIEGDQDNEILAPHAIRALRYIEVAGLYHTNDGRPSCGTHPYAKLIA